MQALARADKPPTLGGPPITPAAFGSSGLGPGRLEGRLGPPTGFGTPSNHQTPGPFGQPPATAPKGFGNSVFGAPANPSQPSHVFGQAASQQPPAFGSQPASGFGTPAAIGQGSAFGQPSTVGSSPTPGFGGGSASRTPAFGAALGGQAPAFGSGVPSQMPAFGGAANQPPAFGGQSSSAFGNSTFGSIQAPGASAASGAGGGFGTQPQQPSPFGGAYNHKHTLNMPE